MSPVPAPLLAHTGDTALYIPCPPAVCMWPLGPVDPLDSSKTLSGAAGGSPLGITGCRGTSWAATMSDAWGGPPVRQRHSFIRHLRTRHPYIRPSTTLDPTPLSWLHRLRHHSPLYKRISTCLSPSHLGTHMSKHCHRVQALSFLLIPTVQSLAESIIVSGMTPSSPSHLPLTNP